MFREAEEGDVETWYKESIALDAMGVDANIVDTVDKN